jgi:diaminohydroxyphosphoribosylaminopyrimidine deaminase / 5-amino-6-(5-phosphoribosylamino)uracil reductase
MPRRRDRGADDVVYMRRALALARRGLGRTSPNPPVGAVVVRNGRIVGEGWHRRAGTPHAEAIALRRAGAAARDATLYLTLEPCTFFGRTPACAPVVIASGIRRVVVATRDPHPRVSGRGIRALRRAGLAVTTGVAEDEARELIAWFTRFITRRRPFVLLKLAASVDGRIATAAGESRWLSAPASRRMVHALRDQVDAVMVGAGTVLADDPALTCRLPRGRDPLRVVVDGRLRISPRARILTQRSTAATLVATSRAAPVSRRRALERAGAEVLVVPGRGTRIDLGALLDRLGARGIASVLLEGGGELAAAALRAKVVDELLLVSTPQLLGGDGRPMLGALGVRRLARAPRLVDRSVRRIGNDLVRRSAVHY